MSDWRDDEQHDEWGGQPRREGVRVVGDDGHEQHDPHAPQAPQAPGRFPLPDDGGSWSADQGNFQQDQYADAGFDPTPAGGVELPHWADPPTGEVPRVLGGQSSDEDVDAWNSAGNTGSGPRFRTGDADWAEGDWGEGELFQDDTVGVAAHGDEDAWGPPPRRGGRRGRRGRNREQEQQPQHEEWDQPQHAPQLHDSGQHRMGPGALEGPPMAPRQRGPQQYDEFGHPIHDDYDDGPSQAELPQRLITAAVVAVVALAAFAVGRGAAMVLVTAVVGVCAFELYAAFQKAGYHPATAIGLLGCVAMVPVGYQVGERAFPLVAILVLTFTCLWYMLEVVHARPVINIALTLIPFAWIGVFGGFAGVMLSFGPPGRGLLLGIVIPAIGSDVVGYFAGRSMGRTPLMPRISPNKTMEGFIAGAITAVVLGAVVGAVISPWKDSGIGAGLVLGILVAITAPLGDLVESMIKRDLGVKDLGGFLPGHGGFLDRFDAILFALPVGYYWFFHLLT